MKIKRLHIVLLLVFFSAVSGISIAQEQTFSPTADASVYEGNKTNNYGAADLLVKHRSGVTRLTYLKFNISTFNLHTAGKATIRVYCNTKETEVSPVNVNLYAVNDLTWNESTLNWNNKPAFGNLLSNSIVEESGKYYEWDVTTYIQNQIRNSNIEVSFVMADISNGNNTLTFNSKENSLNNPHLLITEQPESGLYNQTYYVDAEDGSDTNNGLSVTTAWKSLEKVNNITFSPGAKILLKSGSIWVGQLSPKGSGSLSNPIIIDKYGVGSKPLINGNGMEGQGVVYLFNQSYWEINNLEIINNAATEGDRRGVEVNMANYGLAEHIHFKNLYIHHVKGLIGHDNVHKKTAGIYITTTADDLVETRYNDVLIENCIIHDIQNQGIVTNAVSVADYPGTPNFQRRRITNLVVRNNIIHHISKNAMIIRMADGGLVERNLCYETAIGDGVNYITGNTIFSRTVIGTVFQYNEGFLNRSPDYDGNLYDPDLISPGTIWQYSYSHDNAHGLVWFCTDPRDTGVVVRYNISQNDKGRLVYINYAFTSASIYNNVFYIGAGLSPTIISENKNNDHNYKFYNNIIYNNSSTSKYTFATSGNGVQTRDFSHNIFYGQHPAGEPIDPYKITTDPMFINPGSGATGLTTLDGYKLKPGSPALGAGKIVPDNGGKDFYGNPVSSSTAPNIGVYNGEGQTSMVNPNFHLYLLIGQSNMAGRGVVSGEHVYRSHPRVLMMNASGEWVQAKHPIHFDKPSAAGVGPAMEFAIEMANNNPEITIGLIPAAVGGTAISAWTPGAIDAVTGLKPYDDAISRTHIALQKGVLKGILFHQGEANSGNSNLSAWKTGVKTLANNLRTEFNTPNIPFIVGELGYFRSTSHNINNILPQLVTEIPNSGIVSAEGLTDKGDVTHFDSYSADILGKRYAGKMLEVQAAPIVPVFTDNLAILRAGNGTRANNTGAQQLFVDEYGTDGELVRTLSLPTRETVTGTNNALVAPDLNSTFGLLTLSNDLSRLVITGYEAGLEASGVSTGSGARVAGFVNAGGDIDTKYTINFGTVNIRSAMANGNNIWAVGSSGGIKHIDVTNPSTTTTLHSTATGNPNGPRGINIFNGQLYAASGSAGYYLYKVGTGLPTTSGQTLTLLPGLPTTAGDPYQFVFFDTDGNTEPDLLYIADNTLGLRKFWYNGSVWQDKGTITLSGLRGLTGRYTETGGAILYGVSNASLIKFEDSASPSDNISAPQIILKTAISNTAFKGVAFAPKAEATPVNLLSFTAEMRNNEVRLQWSTASEQNNARFDILRSTTGKSFSRINSVEGYGNTSSIKYYTYNDVSSISGINYYKLSQVDFDGKSKEYGPVAVNTSPFAPEFKVYQSDNKIFVEAYSADEASGFLVITDIAGKELFRQNVALITGNNSFSVSFTTIANGVYLARLQTQAKTLTAKFVN